MPILALLSYQSGHLCPLEGVVNQQQNFLPNFLSVLMSPSPSEQQKTHIPQNFLSFPDIFCSHKHIVNYLRGKFYTTCSTGQLSTTTSYA